MSFLFNIPQEVLDLVGRLLSKHDLAIMVLTCRSLHSRLSPLLWQKFTLEIFPRKQLIPVDQLQTRAHWVHTLQIRDHLPIEYFNIVFPSLSVLQFRIRYSGEEQDYSWACLVRNNPTIQHIELNCYGSFSRTSSDFWSAISSSLHNPKRLKVGGCGIGTFSASVQEMFWRAASKFEEVDYEGSDQLEGGAHNMVDFSRIKRFAYASSNNSATTDCQLGLFSRCPGLTRLSWSHTSSDFPIGDLIAFLKRGMWPLLDDLALATVPQEEEEGEEENSTVIRLAPPLRHFKLRTRVFGSQCFDELGKRHFGTLRSLCLDQCDGMTSRMALVVLKTCSLLEVFKARYINVVDLEECSEPWVCHGLRVLGVCFNGRNSEHHGMQAAVFDQLSKLKWLEEVDLSLMDLPDSRWWKDLVPRWSLNSDGLEKLVTLRRLRKVTFGIGQDLEQEDIDWMLEHWPMIECLEGVLSPSLDLAGHLRSYMATRGVDC